MSCEGEAPQLTRVDRALAVLARADAALRLGLGQALEVLGQAGHAHALGFSSLAAYSLERCERSGRWVEGARCLARRLEGVPALRRALATGQLSWSAAELVARVATPESETHWLGIAAAHTVRELRELVASVSVKAALGRAVASSAVASSAVASSAVASSAVASAAAALGSAPLSGGQSWDDAEACTLTCTVDCEEAWLFEATRSLLEHLGERGSNAQVEALLAEGQVTLLAALPRGAIDPEQLEDWDWAQQRWNEELRRWQSEAEERCEVHIRETVLGRGTAAAETLAEALPDAAGRALNRAALGCSALEGMGALELDSIVRELSAALARQELELSRRLLEFHRADGWRQLGYATEGQYARERLGLSRSLLAARRALGLRLESLPLVARALGSGQLGVEAALQLVRVATPQSEHVWVERARRRTIKHLREEVSAALIAVRLSGEKDCPPPADAEFEAFCALERAVLSGQPCHQQPCHQQPCHQQPCHQRGERRPVEWTDVGSDAASEVSAEAASEAERRTRLLEEPSSAARRAWFVMLASLEQWLATGLEGRIQMSAAPRRAESSTSSAGRVALRLRVSRETYAWWRGLQARAQRWLPRGMSWLKFLCLSLWRSWRHVLGSPVSGNEVEYGSIYVRDRYRCRSPVCSRQDVTPHHLVFRSAGGSDEGSNVATVCSWCHLLGIHGGRIRAQGTADLIHWELGAPGHPCLVVHGRERMAA